VIANKITSSVDPSCTPSILYRGLGIRACLELNPFRSLALGDRPSYPITVSLLFKFKRKLNFFMNRLRLAKNHRSKNGVLVGVLMLKMLHNMKLLLKKLVQLKPILVWEFRQAKMEIILILKS
jgi:hypothetical protein